MPIGRSTIGKATPGVPWHARCVAPENPERWASTVVLGDGDTALIRPITPDDRRRARRSSTCGSRATASTGATSRPSRGSARRSSTTSRRVDFVDRVALVVEAHGEFIAWASYERWHEPRRRRLGVHGRRPPPRQGHRHAAARAPRGDRQVERDHTVHRRDAGREPGDAVGVRARRVGRCNAASSPASSTSTSSSPTRATFLDSVERREQRADSRAISRLLLAPSIAVIGASDTENTVGHVLWRNAARAFTSVRCTR